MASPSTVELKSQAAGAAPGDAKVVSKKASPSRGVLRGDFDAGSFCAAVRRKQGRATSWLNLPNSPKHSAISWLNFRHLSADSRNN